MRMIDLNVLSHSQTEKSQGGGVFDGRKSLAENCLMKCSSERENVSKVDVGAMIKSIRNTWRDFTFLIRFPVRCRQFLST